MTRDEIVDKIQQWILHAGPEFDHPAFDAFVCEMKDRRYGMEETVNAWAFYRAGWDAQAKLEGDFRSYMSKIK